MQVRDSILTDFSGATAYLKYHLWIHLKTVNYSDLKK